MAMSEIEDICILRAGAMIFCGDTKNAPIAGSIQKSVIPDIVGKNYSKTSRTRAAILALPPVG